MDTKTGMAAVLIICGIVLVIGFLRRRAEIVLNFLVRAVLGSIGIYCMNLLFAEVGISAAVGINPLSLLTVGTLGTGGFGLLYGIVLYQLL